MISTDVKNQRTIYFFREVLSIFFNFRKNGKGEETERERPKIRDNRRREKRKRNKSLGSIEPNRKRSKKREKGKERGRHKKISYGEKREMNQA